MRAVIDTNVLFEGLTKQGGAAGLVIDAWQAGLFQPCVSNPLVYEYLDVLARKLSGWRWLSFQPVMGVMLKHVCYVDINFYWRPSSPDPKDDHLIDCAMNANAVLVTTNLRDFRLAQKALGLNVLTPAEFLMRLV